MKNKAKGNEPCRLWEKTDLGEMLLTQVTEMQATWDKLLDDISEGRNGEAYGKLNHIESWYRRLIAAGCTDTSDVLVDINKNTISAIMDFIITKETTETQRKFLYKKVDEACGKCKCDKGFK